MARNHGEWENLQIRELLHVNDLMPANFADESLSDQFVHLPHGESVADSARCLRYGGAVVADHGQLSSPVCVHLGMGNCCMNCAGERKYRYLPEDLFFHILSHLPARVLHDVMRHVCREWDLMIRNPEFIRLHLRSSTSGILIQERGCARRVVHVKLGNGNLSEEVFWARKVMYVELQRGCLDICRLDWGFALHVFTSCNGLILIHDYNNNDALCVMNPLTNQRVILPPYPIQRGTESARLAFSEASMEYKVVHAFGCQSLDQSMRETHIAVLTVGIDYAWRYIDIQHLSLTSKAVLIMSSPMVTGAFMHWIGTTSVLTLNVETETIREYSLPRLHKESGIFLPMGSNLSIIYEFDAFLRDVWEMNPSTGKWIKLLRFDLRPLSHKSLDLFPPQYFVNPVGWLAVREVLLFNMSGSRTCCVAYNLKTKEIRSFQFDTETESYDFQPHLNSLVLFDGGLQMELQPKRLRVS